MSKTPILNIYEKAFAKSDKTDTILVVEGKKLHVNKALLSIHSDYFNTLFNSEFKEKSMKEIEIKDVKYDTAPCTKIEKYGSCCKRAQWNKFAFLQSTLLVQGTVYDEFAIVLSFIHPNPFKPSETYAEKLLELADRFLLPGAKRHLELIFMSATIINRFEKLRIADKYKLDELFDHGLSLYTSHKDFNGLRNYKTFINFSDNSKAKVLDRMMALLNFT